MSDSPKLIRFPQNGGMGPPPPEPPPPSQNKPDDHSHALEVILGTLFFIWLGLAIKYLL